MTKDELPRRRPAEAADVPPLEEEVGGEALAWEEEAAVEEEPAREGRSRRRRRRRGRRGQEGAREEAGRPVRPREVPVHPKDEDDIEPAGEAADFDEDWEAEREAAWEPEDEEAGEGRGARAEEVGERSADEEERRGSRRRRRRRGGQRSAAEGRAAPRDEQRLAREPASAEASGEVDDDQAEASGDDDEGAEAVGVPAHKKIPTWEDAVRILIDANMAARAHHRDRGYGRGRSSR